MSKSVCTVGTVIINKIKLVKLHLVKSDSPNFSPKYKLWIQKVQTILFKKEEEKEEDGEVCNKKSKMRVKDETERNKNGCGCRTHKRKQA